ncbi:MAG: hypothetical protein KAX38_05785, partial [Candidatus Krumholzibacteria bacterium]|nr:hypothetical protein [Candidatus Krumholzibacteria bacterium]
MRSWNRKHMESEGSGSIWRQSSCAFDRKAVLFMLVLVVAVSAVFPWLKCLEAFPAGQDRDQPAVSDTTLYTIKAARLESVIEEGERVILLEGGVRIDHQTATITSRRGKHYPAKRYL